VAKVGQSVFAKRRETPNVLAEGNAPLPCTLLSREVVSKTKAANQQIPRSRHPEQRDLIDRGDSGKHIEKTLPVSIDQLTGDAIKSDFDEELIGKHLMILALGPNGIEHAVAYASILVKARMARLQSAKNGNQS
jgi:hypothetical protein